MHSILSWVSRARRMVAWFALSAVLMVVALFTQATWPGSVLALTLYKAHLLALGGWGGYWLDRALFPYDRPHLHLLPDEEPDDAPLNADLVQVSPGTLFGSSMLRRAVIVAACLICVGLGA